MILADTNIVIYSAQPAYQMVRDFIRLRVPAVSAVSYVEALGFHSLPPAERIDLEDFFAAATVLPLDEPVLDRAVALRQQRRMSLGDAFVAATALVHGLTLATHNTADFRWITALTLVDPLAPPGLPAAP